MIVDQMLDFFLFLNIKIIPKDSENTLTYLKALHHHRIVLSPHFSRTNASLVILNHVDSPSVENRSYYIRTKKDPDTINDGKKKNTGLAIIE